MNKARSSAILCLLLLCTNGADASILAEKQFRAGTHKFTFQKYLWKGQENMRIRIRKGSRLIEELTDHAFFVFSPDKQADTDVFELRSQLPSIDLTGHGASDIILSGWNGAVSGGHSYKIYSPNVALENLWTIEKHATLMSVSRETRELNFEDHTFDYFSDFPPHQLILPLKFKWKHGSFRPIIPQASTVATDISKFEKDADSLESRMQFVRLIYAGRADLAWKLSTSMKEQKSFIRDFYAKFRESPFYFKLIPALSAQSRAAISRMQK